MCLNCTEAGMNIQEMIVIWIGEIGIPPTFHLECNIECVDFIVLNVCFVGKNDWMGLKVIKFKGKVTDQILSL